jgi:GT2 family glycosyltransferase
MQLFENTESAEGKAEFYGPEDGESRGQSSGRRVNHRLANASSQPAACAPAEFQLSAFPISTLSPSYEVIVSDDGLNSTAETMIKERFPWVRWTEGPRRGPAANRNHGASLALGEWLVFTDDDCLPEPSWLHAFSSAMLEHPSALVLEGATEALGLKKHLNEAAPVNEVGGLLWSCNFSIEKATFSRYGGFDEDFPFSAMEDVDLHFRLKSHSIAPLFIGDARVLHPWRVMNNFESIRRYSKSLDIFLFKHPSESRYFHAVCHTRFAWNGFRELVLFLINGRCQGAWFHICQHSAYLMIAVRLVLGDLRKQ